MIARVRWLLVLTLAACLLGAAVAHVLVVRAMLAEMSLLAGHEHGRRIAQQLEASTWQRQQAWLQAYADQHRLVSVEWIDADDRAVPERRVASAAVDRAGDVWHAWVPPPVPVDTALSARAAGGREAQIRVRAAVPDAVPRLRHSLALFAAAIGPAALGAAALAAWLLRTLRRRLEHATDLPPATPAAPANAAAGMSAVVAEPTIPPAARLRKLAKLEGLVVAQAQELDELRAAAQHDALTGLPKRHDALARMHATLEGPLQRGDLQLLLLRVRDLAEVNRRAGRPAADRVLRTIADALRVQSQGDEEVVCGRMNGSDFVFMRPGADQAASTARSLLERLAPTLTALDPRCGVAIGAVRLGEPVEVGRALALADEALARAEAGAAFALGEIGDSPERQVFGDSVWQQRLGTALERGYTLLAEMPVCARDGRVLYLDCPMHMRFDGEGEHEAAARWLPAAIRARMSARIDLHVLQLALDAIAADSQPRCINVCAQSLASSDFLAQAGHALEAAGDDASRLWIDIDESVAVERTGLLREAARRWWPLGVRLGLEHAGERVGQIADLGGLRLDCVRIDARFVGGLTGPDSSAARRHLEGLVQVVHAAGLSITAEGVRLAGDLAVLWALGFDAATGPAVLKRGHSMSPT